MELNNKNMIQLAIDTSQGNVKGNFSSDEAAKIGSDAFFEPDAETSPSSLFPPSIM